MFLVIWGVCLGASAVTFDNRHLDYGPVRRVVPGEVRAVLEIVKLVALVGFCGFHSVRMPGQSSRSWPRNGQVSITAGVPMTIPYAAFVVGFRPYRGVAVAGAAYPAASAPSRRQHPRSEGGNHAVADVVPAARVAGSGLSVFSGAAVDRHLAIVGFTSVPPTAVPQIMFGSIGNLPCSPCRSSFSPAN